VGEGAVKKCIASAHLPNGTPRRGCDGVRGQTGLRQGGRRQMSTAVSTANAACTPRRFPHVGNSSRSCLNSNPTKPNLHPAALPTRGKQQPLMSQQQPNLHTRGASHTWEAASAHFSTAPPSPSTPQILSIFILGGTEVCTPFCSRCVECCLL
jgi:hypothetical protein